MPSKSVLVAGLCAAAVVLAAGCGSAEAPVPARAPAPAPPATPVSLDQADVPASAKDTGAKPEAPPLPDGSRSKFVSKQRGKQIMTAFFRLRDMCRNFSVVFERIFRSASREEAYRVVDRGLGRLEPRYAKWNRAVALLVRAYKKSPRGAVRDGRVPHTLYELVDMAGDTVARDCNYEPGGRQFEKVKRKYGRDFVR
jgi:hypothetical protein